MTKLPAWADIVVWIERTCLTTWHARIPLRLRRPAGTLRNEFRDWQELRGLGELLSRVAPYTMVTDVTLLSLAHQVIRVVREGIPGDFVECGVWRGGASFLMAELLRRLGAEDRRVWLFDSFEGLPPPRQVDGPAAIEYSERTDSPLYRDNCRASLEEVRQAASALGLEQNLRFVKGWFDSTLMPTRSQVGPVALLRIDADWYDSVKTCLEALYDQVSLGGYVILDDYYTWDGCALATHDFLSGRQLPERLEQDACAYFRKRGASQG